MKVPALRPLLRFIAGAFSVACVLTGTMVWLGWEVRRPGPLADEHILVVPRGIGVVQIANQLEVAGAIRWSPLFMAVVAMTRLAGEHELRAGEYALPAAASVTDIVDQMRHGRVVVHRVTVVEGVCAAQVVALLQAEPGLTGDITEVPKDGTLLPDTYHFSLGDSRTALLQRMRTAMSTVLSELWPSRASGLLLQTPAQAVVLASIVEKETGQPGERPRIAGVFYNRLAAHMRLQSDPTVIYALTGGKGPLGRPLTQADWRFESPYNTYQNEGLPPGPIGNPGRAALQAVLNPEHHDWLYFVADGSGGHAFAKSLADHNHNVARWRQLEHGSDAGHQ